MSKELFNTLKSRGCYVRLPPTDTLGRCYTDKHKKQPFASPISTIENVLWEYARSIGVRVSRPREGKDKILLTDKRLRDSDIIIGAGGKNDVVYEVLNDGEVDEELIGYGLTITWNPDAHKTYGKVSSPSGKASQHRFRFFRSPENSNFYGTIQLTPKEYEKVKNLRNVKDVKDASILRRIMSLMDYYNVKPNEFKWQGQMTAFPITLHKAERLADVVRDKLLMIVGDATIGDHYFSGTGVNTGFKHAHYVAQSICEMIRKNKTRQFVIKEYTREAEKAVDASLEKSRKVILNHKILGVCNKNTVKELRALAKKKHYKGIQQFPKHDLCLILANEFIE
jgi:2-polyprenyl-6-methoxyphenol hydroxylase-like FAD-dependent oxidoreductase